ncbi:hypothetical protein [Pseudomonas yamanorum]
MTLFNASLTTGRAPNINWAPLERLAQAPATPPLSSDSTRAAGDKALAQNLCNTLANGLQGQTNIVVPPHSTLGVWQAQLNNAMKNPEFQYWVKTQGIPPGSINLYPDTNQLTATINNQTKTFTLDDQSGWRDVAGPVLAAAKIFAGGIDGPVAHYHINATDVPHWLVANFYGQDLDPTSLAQLASTYTFAPPVASLAASRSEQALQNQQQVLGDINDRKTLRLKLQNKVRAGMRLAGFNVDPNSSHQPKGFTSAEDFITGKGWKLPTTNEGFDNLLAVLSTPVPQGPPLADFWGLLSTPVPLSAAQRSQLSAATQAEIAPGQTLFSTLMGPTNTARPTSPREQLEQMLTHPKALALGQRLEAELGVLPTPTSRRELVLSALVLSLDANAGATRNKIAQYQLDQPGNWGKKPVDIVQSLGEHLMNQSRVQPAHKGVAAYLMLSHVAPALLVQGLPDDLRYGTHQWAALSSAISKIEHLAPGASATMGYQQINDLAELEPITDNEEKLDQHTRLEAMIDWAITNGALPKKDDGNYSAGDITTAKAAYQKEFSDLGFAGQHLLKAIPTRRQMALDDLKRVYGESVNLETPVLQSIDGDQNRFYNLLDAHMAGKLVKGSWRSINSQVSMQDLEQKFSRLNNIPRVFESAADFHHYNLQRSEAILVQHLLAQLPETHQQHLSLGKQKFYSLRKAISGASHLVTQEAIENGKGRHGIIIRSELGADVRYYEVFPSLKKIVVRTDLPADLPAGRNVVPYSNFETNKRQAFDWDAYSSGTEPIANVRSELIIEELIPGTPWAPQPHDKTPGLSYSNSKTTYLASVAANQHLVVPKKTFISAAAGESAIELQQRHAEAGAAAALGLIPFANTLKYAIEGKAAEAIGSFLTDATTLVLPAPKGLGTALRHSAKSLNTLRVMLTKATSHTDDLLGLVVGSHKNAKSFYSTIPAFGHKFAVANNLLKEASIAKGTISSIGNGSERTALLAKFEGDKWYAVNPNSGTAYGTPLEGFVAETNTRNLQGFFDFFSPAAPADNEFSDLFVVKISKTKYGDEAAFKRGYDTLKPDGVPGYSTGMSPYRIKELIVNGNLTAEQIGSLVRQREKLFIAHARSGAEVFKREIEAAGGTTRGMPQSFYLALTNFDVDGECAALSSAMAVALGEGTENTLLDNLAYAMANPDSAEARTFINDLSALQSKVVTEINFHGANATAAIPYTNIIAGLSNAKASKTLMISTSNHGMLAGVRVSPNDASLKTWFYYDPNYGLATFPSAKSMAKGLEKTLNSGTVGKSLSAFGTILTGRMYKTSEFDVSELAQRNFSIDSTKTHTFDINRIKGLSQPLA